MDRSIVRLVSYILCFALTFSLTGCAASGEELVKKSLEAISENKTIQTWMEEHDQSTLSEEAIAKFKESIPVLQEFLAREDVQEKFRTVGLPMIEEFLNYGIESMRLKAETLGNIIRIFAPELTEQVDAIFETAPVEGETTEIPENN